MKKNMRLLILLAVLLVAAIVYAMLSNTPERIRARKAKKDKIALLQKELKQGTSQTNEGQTTPTLSKKPVLPKQKK